MREIEIHTKTIRLVQALKLIGMTGTGGQAKNLVADGLITVNGSRETRTGRQLFPGDRIGLATGEEIIMVCERRRED